MPAKNRRGEKRPKRSWELDDIQKLIDLVIERGIDEFEIERNGLRIWVKRGGGMASAGSAFQSVPSSGVYVSPAATQTLPAGSSLETPSAPARVQTSEEEGTEELHIVKSPIVGTFYNTPAPNAPPFVKLGDVVKVGQVLCIIEAMKLMNEIESDEGGEIVRIYVENGQPVEYGQSLFAIKPSLKK
jgi:acetyl-CoA carboxylase biotin carboxyl carrier protein